MCEDSLISDEFLCGLCLLRERFHFHILVILLSEQS